MTTRTCTTGWPVREDLRHLSTRRRVAVHHASRPCPQGGIPDAQTVFEPLLQLLGACTVALQTPGPRLALSTLVELLRVDLVESESLEQPQRRRSKPGQRLFVDTSTDTPALVCDRLALELDVRHPGNPGTCAHVAVDVQYVAQQVNMPLLRLLNQFSSMYENVKETRLELQCRRPRADSVVVPMPQPHPGGSHESVAPVQTSTPRCWKTMCFLLDLYETMPPSQALADRFTISVGVEHKVTDGPEGCRGNCKYEQLHEHRVNMETGDAQAQHREVPPRPAAGKWLEGAMGTGRSPGGDQAQSPRPTVSATQQATIWKVSSGVNILRQPVSCPELLVML
ncbi:hypothetical protein MRX96_003498 [Rhipicephalus microplus]